MPNSNLDSDTIHNSEIRYIQLINNWGEKGVIVTCGNDGEIKFWVPPTKWIGEDSYMPNLKVQENSGFELKLKSTGSEKKTKAEKDKKKKSKKNDSDYSESDSSSDDKESKEKQKEKKSKKSEKSKKPKSEKKTKKNSQRKDKERSDSSDSDASSEEKKKPIDSDSEKPDGKFTEKSQTEPTPLQ